MHSFTLAALTPSYREFFLATVLGAATAGVLVLALGVVVHPATIKTEQKITKILAFMHKLPTYNE